MVRILERWVEWRTDRAARLVPVYVEGPKPANNTVRNATLVRIVVGAVPIILVNIITFGNPLLSLVTCVSTTWVALNYVAQPWRRAYDYKLAFWRARTGFMEDYSNALVASREKGSQAIVEWELDETDRINGRHL